MRVIKQYLFSLEQCEIRCKNTSRHVSGGIFSFQTTITVSSKSQYYNRAHSLLVFLLPFGRSHFLFLYSRAVIMVCPVTMEYQFGWLFQKFSKKWFAMDGASRYPSTVICNPFYAKCRNCRQRSGIFCLAGSIVFTLLSSCDCRTSFTLNNVTQNH
jgi:hypothetical protein